MLSRHAAEIKSLDAQLDDIVSSERVVAAFFEEYMNPGRPTAPTASDPEQARTAPLSEQEPAFSPGAAKGALHDAPNSTKHIAEI